MLLSSVGLRDRIFVVVLVRIIVRFTLTLVPTCVYICYLSCFVPTSIYVELSFSSGLSTSVYTKHHPLSAISLFPVRVSLLLKFGH